MKLSNIRGIIIFIAALLTGIITVALNLGTLTTAIGDKFYDGNYYPQAYFCYSVGALVNSPDCEIRLSYMYENGIAVSEDQSEAEHYAALAHNHGLHIIREDAVSRCGEKASSYCFDKGYHLPYRQERFQLVRKENDKGSFCRVL